MSTIHGQLTVTVNQPDPTSPDTESESMLSGCQGCVTDALAKAILQNPQFRQVVYMAIKIADQKRALNN